MAGWIKAEKRQVTQWGKTHADGSRVIKETKVIGFEWFPIESQPEYYRADDNGVFWCTTTDVSFSKEKPE
jgi:hypothetical protein